MISDDSPYSIPGSKTQTAGKGAGAVMQFSGEGMFILPSHIGGISLAGPGTVQISAAPTRSVTFQNSATLQITSAISSSNPLILEKGVDTIDIMDKSCVFSGAVSGSGKLVKQGAGSLELGGDISGFTGAILVGNGMLIVKNKFNFDSSVTVNGPGSEMHGFGGFKTLTISNGGKFSGDIASNVGIIVFASLVVKKQSTLRMTIAGDNSTIYGCEVADISHATLEITIASPMTTDSYMVLMTGPGGVIVGKFDQVLPAGMFDIEYDIEAVILTVKGSSQKKNRVQAQKIQKIHRPLVLEALSRDK